MLSDDEQTPLSSPLPLSHNLSFSSWQYLKLRECEDVEDADQRLKQLQACQSMFSTTPTLKKNVQYVEEYVKLVKKQKQIVVSNHLLTLQHPTTMHYNYTPWRPL